MADAAVEFLLENLKQLLLYHGDLIISVKEQVEKLEEDLRLLRAFLRDTSCTTKKRKRDETIQEVVRQIREVVYEAEDAVDCFVTQAAENKSRSYFARAFKTPGDLHTIARKVEAVSKKVGAMFGDKTKIDLAFQSIGDGEHEDSEIPELRRANIVGFKDEAEMLKGYLREETEKLDVISIIGMPGLGKTTLAGMIFHDEAIKLEFPTRVWVYVSSEFTKKDVFISILKELGRLSEDIYQKDDQELAKLVRDELEKSKFLIVMDDVWTAGDWDELKTALPDDGGMGKVLITSRQEDVGKHSNRSRAPHNLRFLTHEESYDKLPHHLRACFLYLGSIFPENYEISVWKLIRMWIAEGFIQQKQGFTLEETAEDYLGDLINRNLVRIDKMSSDGKVKTCRIHDMLREFCKTLAGNQRENFLQEIKKSSDGGFEPPTSEMEKLRRLCIHSNVLNFLSSKPAPGVHVRTFACFSKEDFQLPQENNSSIPAAFKLLRVLDIKPIRFIGLHSDLYQLIHLKYFHMSFNLKRLPKSFHKLWNIQTLVIDTTSRTLEINADIWQMIHLRHLKTNASATLPETGKNSKGGEKLQTLGTISPGSCTEEVFNRACNLKKLGIRGRLPTLLDGKNGSFDSLGKLGNLEKLKLLNDVFPRAPSEGQLDSLPPPYKFPPQLKSLTLSETFLNWSHISILGLLDNLKVLKLKEKAFMGDRWQAANGGFRSLEVLHIGRTDLLYWEASGDHFPNLKLLELHNCEELLEIPIGLADIPTLQKLDLYFSKSAAASAKKIENVKKESRAQVSEFKLSIFPPQA